MKKEEYEKLFKSNVDTSVYIKVSDLKNKEDRTLIFGYDVDRNSFHVYFLNGKFNIIIYSLHKLIYYSCSLEKVDSEKCIPNKRIYPESCDYEFVNLLIEKGFGDSLCVLPFDEKRAKKLENKRFHGKVISEIGEEND